MFFLGIHISVNQFSVSQIYLKTPRHTENSHLKYETWETEIKNISIIKTSIQNIFLIFGMEYNDMEINLRKAASKDSTVNFMTKKKSFFYFFSSFRIFLFQKTRIGFADGTEYFLL